MITKGNNRKKKVDSATRVKLIRKGNEYLNNGSIELAEKIFITIDYKDGLIRLGDYYFNNNNLYKSAEMYFLSENQSKIDAFCKRTALIIEKLLNDDNKTYEKIIVKKGVN